jgi:branched-subunit amino acid transport protein
VLPLLDIFCRGVTRGGNDFFRLSFTFCRHGAAILSALLAPALLVDSAQRSFSVGEPELLVAIPTLFFALKTRSLGGTVLVGMVLYWLAGSYL